MDDIIVIGGGPGGYVAAIRAAQLGLKTTLIEGQHLGGVCLNWGCIPTKALLRTAEIYDFMHRAEEYGLSVEKASFDLSKIVKRSRDIAGQLSGGVKHLLKKNKVNVVDGWASLQGQGKVAVKLNDGSQQTLEAKHIILATGARARTLPGLEPDGKFIWTAKEAMVPEDMPKKLLVIGSGAIGMEFASFYNTLGVDTTVVEMMDRILPAEDAEISAFAKKQFEKQGMKVLTSAKTENFIKKDDGVEVTINGELQKFDRIILAIGIVGNVENCGLENTKVQVDRTHIVIDAFCQTHEPGVYAIGDIAGPPWLAHKASHEGIMCVEKIAGHRVHPLDPKSVPGCTYCHPQVASVGYTEAQATEKGHKIKVGRFPFIGNGKAIALGEPEGLIKTIFDAETGQLLGAHMIGAEVTELIQGFVVARTLETTEEDLMHTIFPHPTLSEMLHESTLAAYGKAIHY